MLWSCDPPPILLQYVPTSLIKLSNSCVHIIAPLYIPLFKVPGHWTLPWRALRWQFGRHYFPFLTMQRGCLWFFGDKIRQLSGVIVKAAIVPLLAKKIAASQRRRIHHIFGETRSCFWNSSDTGQNMYVFSEECLFNEYRQLQKRQSYQPINIGIYRFFLYIWVYLLVNKSSYFSVITERQSCLSAKITDNRTLGESLIEIIEWLGTEHA